MIAYTKEEACRLMNLMGRDGRPFLFLVDYKEEQIYVESTRLIEPSELRYNLNGFTNDPPRIQSSPGPLESGAVQWSPSPVSREAYAASFQKVKNEIQAGNSYLVNLTCSTPVETNLTLEGIYNQSAALYKLWMKDRFVVFSPEIFVRLEDGCIFSYPMKGTIDASLPDARRRILEDPKEAAEHATIVDLIRNDLSRVATEVTVSRYRYVDEVQTNGGTLLQVSSEINGKLVDGWQSHLGDLLFHLLPAGSITGAPKRKTIEIISEAETYERGFYTGVMGYFDGFSLDSAVMIRFLEQDANGHMYFKSGGGITSQSDLDSEYNEMKQKIYVPIY